MKKLKWKELIVLLLPVLALAGFTLFRPEPSPTLAFSKAQVEPVPFHERNRHNSYYPDTRLTIEVLCRKPFLLNRLWEKRSILYKANSVYLSDAKGRKYTQLKDYGGSSSVSNVRGAFMPGDGRGISYIHEFHLAQIPISAGKITFNATYIADDGFQLPVTVVVRH